MKKLLLALLLLIPHPSFASFTRVQFVSGSGITGLSYPSVAAGNTLIYQVASFAFAVTSVNGDNGNTWTHATSANCTNGTITEYVDTFYVASATSGTTVASPVSSASFAYVAGFEYSHTGPSFGFDLATCGSGSGTASSLSLTTTYNNELLVSLVVADSGAVSSAPSTWTDFVAIGTSYNDGSANLLDAGTNGAQSANFSFPSSNWVQTYIAFHDDTMMGGGGGVVPLSGLTLIGVGR